MTSAALLPLHYKDRAADIFKLLAVVIPVATTRTVERIISARRAPSAVALPSNVHLKLVDVLATCATETVRSSFHEAPDIVGKVVVQLKGTTGILSWKRVNNLECECVLRCTLHLIDALISSHGLATAATVLKDVVEVVQECMQLTGNKKTTCALRCLLSRSVAAAFAHDPKLFTADALDSALDLVRGLAADESYAGRLAGGQLVPIILNKLIDPTVRIVLVIAHKCIVLKEGTLHLVCIDPSSSLETSISIKKKLRTYRNNAFLHRIPYHTVLSVVSADWFSGYQGSAWPLIIIIVNDHRRWSRTIGDHSPCAGRDSCLRGEA